MLNSAEPYSPQVVDPLDLLFDRTCVLASRVADGTISFLDAVDMAASAADFAGITDRVGPDVVQRVLATAFMGVRPE